MMKDETEAEETKTEYTSNEIDNELIGVCKSKTLMDICERLAKVCKDTKIGAKR